MVRFLLIALAAFAVACGEPPVDVAIPERAGGATVVDHAGILTGSEIEAVLGDMPADVVALTFESGDATLGEAHRAAQALLRAWGADVVLVAAARPGDFGSDSESRRRFFGVFPADRFRVPGGVRERIVEEVVPPLAADNDWPGVFRAAADEVRGSLR